jgi:hypothetical protein
MNLMINWAAVSVAMLVGLAVQGLWYTNPQVYPRWKALVFGEAEPSVGVLPRVAVAVVSAFASAWCLAGFLNFTGSADFLQGSLAGLQLFLGLVAPVVATLYVFDKRNLGLLWMELTPVALALALQGGLLAAWR